MSALIGYACVSTQKQDADLQRRAPQEAGGLRIFTVTASGAQRDLPQLAAALDFVRPGDTLVVWRLDRLSLSLKQLLETVELLEPRSTHFRSLNKTIETGPPGGRLVFSVFGALAEF